MLRRLPTTSHPDLLVGSDTSDDAAVWRRPDGPCLVSTADFFTPIVDDPRVWGAISATNAVSDVFAMGGTPLFGLNLVVWPKDDLSPDLLAEVLLGGHEAAERGNWVIGGGHTVDGPEPMYGQQITGQVDEADLLTNSGARPGEALILTKALGTGLVATAVKRLTPVDVADGGEYGGLYSEAVASMTRLNDIGASVAKSVGSRAATDVTGFGLLGHLGEMTRGSGVGAVIDVAATPELDGVRRLLDAGFVPGGTQRNLDHVRDNIDPGGVDESGLLLLADAQTSGGLLFSCAPDRADDAVAELVGTGHKAARIGEVVEGTGRIELR